MVFERRWQGLKQCNPLTRFSAVAEQTIEQNCSEAADCCRDDSIRVLSWNIAKNNHRDHWQQEFWSLVEHYNPDQIFLQEARLCAKTNTAFGLDKLNELGLRWSYAPNFIDEATQTYSGVLTATKLQLLSSRSLMSSHSEPITQTHKVTLLSEYLMSEGVEPNESERLLTVNTHLINFVTLGKFKAQLQDIEIALQAHAGPIIFSGDFNTWNLSRWQLLSQVIERVDLTVVAFDAEKRVKIKRFLRSPPLDHIFYRGFRQRSKSADVVDTVTSSDHNPLVVELIRL